MEQSNYRRRTYTPEEDAIIIKAVSQHYYKYLTEPNHNNRTNACFMTVGKEQVNVKKNTKYHI